MNLTNSGHCWTAYHLCSIWFMVNGSLTSISLILYRIRVFSLHSEPSIKVPDKINSFNSVRLYLKGSNWTTMDHESLLWSMIDGSTMYLVRRLRILKPKKPWKGHRNNCLTIFEWCRRLFEKYLDKVYWIDSSEFESECAVILINLKKILKTIRLDSITTCHMARIRDYYGYTICYAKCQTNGLST